MKPNKMCVTYPNDVQVTLTLTYTLGTWKRIRDGGNWNSFREAVDMAARTIETDVLVPITMEAPDD